MIHKWLFAATFHKLTIISLNATTIVLIEKLLFLCILLFNTGIILLLWNLDWEIPLMIRGSHWLIVSSKFHLVLHIAILLNIVAHWLHLLLMMRHILELDIDVSIYDTLVNIWIWYLLLLLRSMILRISLEVDIVLILCLFYAYSVYLWIEITFI
jgi:hypothetical protein